MKNKRSMVIVLIFALVFSCSGLTAFAAKSDVDFTLNVADDLQYKSKDTIDVPIIIKTQTDNGFVDLEMYLMFDPDYLNCSTLLDSEVDGFTTHLYERESDGEYGLVINYSSPDGTRTKKDTQIVFTVTFAVKTGVASNENCLLKLEVLPKNVYGLNSSGEKNPGLLTVSDAKDKALIIVETNDDAVTTAPDAGDDPIFYISSTNANPEDPGVTSSGGGCSGGAVVGIIFGALVVFAAGVVVGFIFCQKRMNEDGYNVQPFSLKNLTGGRGGDSPRTFTEVNDEYTRSTGRNSIYDEDIPTTRPVPKSPLRQQMDNEDDRVNTSYFGRANDTRIGGDFRSQMNTMSFDDDDDDDDEFPSSLAPRSRGGSTENLFGTVSRRERNDDGYGSFETDDDDDDGGKTDYRSDRRRYR